MTQPPLTEHMPAGRPAAEVAVDEVLVRRLLAAQHPDLSELPLSHLDSGWDNVLFRLGNEFVVRIPRRKIAADLIHNEQIWLPFIGEQLPIAVPQPVRIGLPTDFYPWRWSVLPWFDGQCADEQPPSADQADRFADFLLALHQPAPGEAPRNPVRGVPLQVREANTLERMARVREKTELITPAIDAIWQSGLSAPKASESCWLHGDLHAQNVLVGPTGDISAIIDWGDITGGDAATDLAGIWALFESAEVRRGILERYGPDDALRARAQGWAVLFGVVLVDSGLINSPRHALAGRRILERLAEESESLA